MIGVSPAVINSFTTMSSFTTALLFYILYKEKLNKSHIFGMLLIVGSVLIVAVCKTIQMNSTQIVDDKDLYLSALDQDDETSSEKLRSPQAQQ
jgi:O-antigen ligase